ncbi:MAG: hypothetical protein EB032_11860, partial [Betaproteobacteria bacterium]|nr:hypothetical protein [Betaproteobacteria bacterium]
MLAVSQKKGKRRVEATHHPLNWGWVSEFQGAGVLAGLGEDFGNRERLAKLLRFASTSSDEV